MRTAIVTASYRGDFERCRLLCDSIERRVSNHTEHYILVEGRDVPLFKALAGPRRRIVDEREILPSWLRSFPDPLSFGRRRVWLSPKGPPLRGWHVQQLRRIAMAATMDEEVMVSCDSDVVFLKPFDVRSLHRGGAVRFYCQAHALPDMAGERRAEHYRWSRKAGQLLAIAAPPVTDAGYIATLIPWRTDTAREMSRHIEAVAGRPLMATLAATRVLSECVIYGRFVAEVEARPDRHMPYDTSFCRVYWSGAAMNEHEIGDFAAALEPSQVAAGIQSFIGTDLRLIRQAAGLA